MHSVQHVRLLNPGGERLTYGQRCLLTPALCNPHPTRSLVRAREAQCLSREVTLAPLDNRQRKLQTHANSKVVHMNRK
jgi:hypothetical protein